jgi:amidase/6-aminohexanoate-cyclic-dimer hydrolase
MALTDAEYLAADALELARLVAAKEVTPLELLAVATKRIDQQDREINAVVRRDLARAERLIADGLPAGPFHGVPFLLKDVGPPEAGQPLTFGSRYFEGYTGLVDATLVKRYRQAGLVIFGRTASPELGLCPATEPATTGACRNPWRLDRQTGGSSGGAAAAVAAGYVPMAQGGDGGGSIRLPAAHTGVYGFKPSRARNPSGPVIGEGWGGLVSAHVLTRTVRDSAAALDATQGPEAGDPYAAPPPAGSYLNAIERPPQGLRVGLITRAADGTAPDAEVLAAVEATARLLERMGHHVIPAELPAVPRAWDDFWLIVAANAAAAIDGRATAIGRAPAPEELEPITWAIYEKARRFTAVELAGAIQRCHMIGRTIGRQFQDVDILLSPVFAAPPGPIGSFSMQEDSLARYDAENRAGMPYTWWFNVAGCPAASLPLAMSAEGTPIGVQIAAAFGRDDLVLALSAAVEAAAPWDQRRPALF